MLNYEAFAKSKRGAEGGIQLQGAEGKKRVKRNKNRGTSGVRYGRRRGKRKVSEFLPWGQKN